MFAYTIRRLLAAVPILIGEFIATAKKENLEIRPQTAEVLAQVVTGILNAPQDVRDRMKVALQPRDEHTQEIKAKK